MIGGCLSDLELLNTSLSSNNKTNHSRLCQLEISALDHRDESEDRYLNLGTLNNYVIEL